MEYVALVFSFFGLYAFCQAGELKRRMDKLEGELTKMKGTSFNEARKDLVRLAKEYAGKSVKIGLKEDYMDADIVTYGNTKHGSNTIIDVDDEWMIVKIITPKTEKIKMIRMEAIQTISED